MSCSSHQSPPQNKKKSYTNTNYWVKAFCYPPNCKCLRAVVVWATIILGFMPGVCVRRTVRVRWSPRVRSARKNKKARKRTAPIAHWSSPTLPKKNRYIIIYTNFMQSVNLCVWCMHVWFELKKKWKKNEEKQNKTWNKTWTQNNKYTQRQCINSGRRGKYGTEQCENQPLHSRYQRIRRQIESQLVYYYNTTCYLFAIFSRILSRL